MATLYEVLQLQRQRRETGPCPLNLENQRRYPRLPQIVIKQAVSGDRSVYVSEEEWRVRQIARREER